MTTEQRPEPPATCERNGTSHLWVEGPRTLSQGREGLKDGQRPERQLSSQGSHPIGGLERHGHLEQGHLEPLLQEGGATEAAMEGSLGRLAPTPSDPNTCAD